MAAFGMVGDKAERPDVGRKGDIELPCHSKPL
jgi:hypothetical protein